MLFLRIFKHLLPRARAWRLPVELATQYAVTCNTGNLYTSGDGQASCGRTEYVKSIYRTILAPARYLYKFFKGLAEYPAIIRAAIDLVFFDIFPDETRELEKWETQFNLVGSGTDTERRADLAAAWQAQGGQGFDYLQGLIWSAGFTDVHIHEWWDGAATRDPFSYINASNNPLPSGGFLLVNKGPTVAVPEYPVYMGAPDSDFGSVESETAGIEGALFYDIDYPLPTDPATWPFFIYIGAEVFPNKADVSASRQAEFERLLLRYFPDQQWLGLLINYV